MGLKESLSGSDELDFALVGEPLKKHLAAFPNLIDRSWPGTLATDSGIKLLLHSFAKVVATTYETIIWSCADKPPSAGRKAEFVLSVPVLIRSTLDQIFTLCYISEDVENRTLDFCRSGWKENKDIYEQLLAQYGEFEKWKEPLALSKELLDALRVCAKISPEEEAAQAKIPWWPIPSRMTATCIKKETGEFLEYLNDWMYKELSQASHLTVPGLIVRGFPLMLAHTGSKNEEEMAEHLGRVKSAEVVNVAPHTLSIA